MKTRPLMSLRYNLLLVFSRVRLRACRYHVMCGSNKNSDATRLRSCSMRMQVRQSIRKDSCGTL
jgi:hypothetical protein